MWKIERDSNGDIKLYHVVRGEQDECIGVAWFNKETKTYSVYDIRKGGGPLSDGLRSMPFVAAALLNLVYLRHYPETKEG